MPRIKLLVTAILLTLVQTVFAQGTRISGKVSDDFGPVMMANVVERDANNRIVTAAAYTAGAREVIVHFRDDKISRMRYEYAPTDVFTSVPEWESEGMNYYAARGAAFLSIVSEDPEAFK